jgi:hypothetical protein
LLSFDIIPVNGKCNTPPPFVIYGYPNPVTDDHITLASKEVVFNGKHMIRIQQKNGSQSGIVQFEKL